MRFDGISTEISVIRSDRRTISAQIKPDCSVLVRAPRRASQADIERFLRAKAALIERHIQKRLTKNEEQGELIPFTQDEIRQMAEQAMQIIPPRVAHYAKIIGVTYGRITIRNQKTRWGSCSSRGNLNFNCLLVLVPPDVLDSVVVHELCHRLYLNHSRDFYDAVYRAYPDYDRCHAWLRENGNSLIQRMIAASQNN